MKRSGEMKELFLQLELLQEGFEPPAFIVPLQYKAFIYGATATMPRARLRSTFKGILVYSGAVRESSARAMQC